MLKLALLGTGGMMPLPGRYLTSLLLQCEGKSVLIDCGECTQVSLKSLHWGIKNIDIICLTHFHADHTAGLPGLLSTIANSGKTTPLTIIGPVHTKEVLEHLLVIVPQLPFPIHVKELNSSFSSYTEGNFEITALPVEHHISCFAYSIDVKRRAKFNVEKALKNCVPKFLWNKLQKNGDIEHEGTTYTPEMVLGEERRGLKISYCTDSRPVPSLVPFIKDSDVFVCEGMYGDDEDLEKAASKKHMIFSEAATLAKQGNVQELWLTHFSPALVTPKEYLHFATDIFPNTKVGETHLNTELTFK